MVGKLSRMSWSGQETHSDDREWLGDTPGCPGVLGRSLRCPGVVGSPTWMAVRPFRISGSVQETLLDVREKVGRPSRMSGSGQEALPNVLEWSGVPPGCPGVVERPSWICGRGRETLSDVLEWSGDPLR